MEIWINPPIQIITLDINKDHLVSAGIFMKINWVTTCLTYKMGYLFLNK